MDAIGGPVSSDNQSRAKMAEVRAANESGIDDWDRRRKMIGEVFPSVERLDWRKAFDAPGGIDLLGRILRDVLKADQAVPGRPGPRPALDRSRAEPVLDSWMGRDPRERPYTNLDFPDAFALLINHRSLAQVSRKVEMPKSHLSRLLRGFTPPSIRTMERVALAYDKHPSYFKEFRVAAITSSVRCGLSDEPDSTIRYYEALYR